MGVVTTVVGRTVVPLVGGTGIVAVVEDVGGTVVVKGTPVDTGVVPAVVVVTSMQAMIPTVTYALQYKQTVLNNSSTNTLQCMNN
jgi:hypothetical protein